VFRFPGSSALSAPGAARPGFRHNIHWSQLVLLVPAALALAALLGRGPDAAVAATAVVLLVLLAAFPEVTFGLFLLVGVLKSPLSATVAAAGVQLDVTVLLAAVLLAGLLIRGLPAGIGSLLPPADAVLPLGGLGLIVLLSLLLGPETPYGQQKAVRFLTLTSLAFLAPYGCLNTPARFTRFLVTTIGIGLLMLPLGQLTGEGLSAFGANHIATGRALGLGLLAVIFLGLGSARLPLRLVWVVPGAALLAGFLYAGSRGSFLALAAALAVTGLVVLARGRARRRALAVAAVAALAAVGVTILAPAAVETMNRRVAATLADPLTLTARTRLDRAAAALEMIQDRPVWGNGIGGFDLLYSHAETGRGDYPHNLLLEVLAELGVVGLLALSLLMFLALRRLGHGLQLTAYGSRPSALGIANWRLEIGRRRPEAVSPLAAAARPQAPASLFVLALATYALANALFSGDLNDNRLLFVALGMCFLPLAARPRDRATAAASEGRG